MDNYEEVCIYEVKEAKDEYEQRKKYSILSRLTQTPLEKKP